MRVRRRGSRRRLVTDPLDSARQGRVFGRDGQVPGDGPVQTEGDVVILGRPDGKNNWTPEQAGQAREGEIRSVKYSLGWCCTKSLGGGTGQPPFHWEKSVVNR